MVETTARLFRGEAERLPKVPPHFHHMNGSRQKRLPEASIHNEMLPVKEGSPISRALWCDAALHLAALDEPWKILRPCPMNTPEAGS